MMTKGFLRDMYRELREFYYLCSGKPKGVGYILMMHHVLPNGAKEMPVDGYLNITPEYLDEFLLKAKEKFDFIPLVEVPNRIVHPRKRKFMVFTFDDGFESVYKYAYPLFKKYNVPFTAFISTGFIGRLCATYRPVEILENGMNLEQLKDMSKNTIVTLGGHTVTHQLLAHVPIEQMKQEIEDNVKQLKECVGVNITTFAYPFGDQNADVIKEISSSESGIKIGVLATGNAVSLSNDNNYLLPRVNLDNTVNAKDLLHWRGIYMGW